MRLAVLLAFAMSSGCGDPPCPAGSHKIPGPRCVEDVDGGDGGEGEGEGEGEDPRCGDGTIDEGEECDEGSNNDDTQPDACRTSCRAPSCGDGVVDRGESCDEGAANGDDATCRTNCALASCGDGRVDPGEQCDDGEANDDGAVRCWGAGASGRLGYGNTNDIGDDEEPVSAGSVPLF